MRWATAVRDGDLADATYSVVPRARGRVPGPALQGLLALVVYLVAFILGFGQPLAAHLSSPQVGQVEVDPNFYIWAWRWWTYAVTHGLNPLYSGQIGAPGGYNLAWATTTPSVALFMAPVTAAFGPVTSFNLTLLLAPPASAWAAFVAARRLTGRFWAALPAGVVYAFNVYSLDHEVSGQPNLTVTLLPPLMVYLVLLWWDGALGRAGYVTWMTIALALEFYLFIEAFAEVTAMLAAALAIGFVVAGRATRPRVLLLARLTGVAYLGAVALALPYLRYALGHYPSTLTRQQPWFSLDLSGLVVPRPDRTLGMRWWVPAAGHDLTSTSYVGIPLLVLWLLLAVCCWSSRLARLLAIGFAVAIAVAAGPRVIIDGRAAFPLPWGRIWNWPFLRSAEPDRFIVFGYLVLAMAMAVWLGTALDPGRLRRARGRVLASGRWAVAVVALAAILADLPTFAEVVVPPKPDGWTRAVPSLPLTNAIPAFFATGAYRRYLRPGEIVAVVSRRGNAGMLFQAYTGFYFRIAGGFINASLTQVDALPAAVESLKDPNESARRQFDAYVSAAGVGAVIVERAWSEKWMYNFGQVGLHGTTVGGVTIYRTAAASAALPVSGVRRKPSLDWGGLFWQVGGTAR